MKWTEIPESYRYKRTATCPKCGKIYTYFGCRTGFCSEEYLLCECGEYVELVVASA